MSDNRTSGVSQAVQLFRDGCACSQAVLAAYAAPLGLTREQALKVASGFGGGMRMSETCGAVTGALMVLGLRHAKADCGKGTGRNEINDRVREFTAQFRARKGSVACRDLLGCDISTPEGMTYAKAHNLFKTTCVEMVQAAAGILEEMAAEAPRRVE